MPDLNRDHGRPVLRAGPQPRSWEASVACRTSTAIMCIQCCVFSRMSERMSEDMSERLSKDMSERISEYMSQDMSERIKDMSERISERMSEDMSERMSEDMYSF